ncbi:MAG: neutral/alkaline non-lysosomal ceramidase N-terminal domain-containing protein [Moraxellaceae bacterium]|nr:neutral/alkaline non-lysosomal ceramidase N-terminal domain-containing protein [Moraxellaceae bacterium]
MYQAGWGKQEIGIVPKGYAMQGYGMWQHRARGVQSPLFARALFLQDEKNNSLIFCCLDLGYVTHAMRTGVCTALREHLGEAFNEAALVLTCTHTHSGPGGCTHDVMYNIVTPGFVPEHVQKIVEAVVAAVLQARHAAAPTDIALAQGAFADDVPVAWNRSLQAYNRNPDVTPRRVTETHLAIDRGMTLLSLRRHGELQSLLSLFGVHATCVGSSLLKHDGDNKGYAASHAENALEKAGVAGAVAIFAQATAGDVSPHYHGPGDVARRKKIKGDAEYAYAEQNGRHQSERALSLLSAQNEEIIGGDIDAVFSYADFTRIKVDPVFANGNTEAWTSEPCHGVAFFAGTPVDGPGMPLPLAALSRKIAGVLKSRRLNNPGNYSAEDQAYYRRIYAAQGEKAILLETDRKSIMGQPLDSFLLPGFADPLVGEMKRQARRGAIGNSAMVPTVLPLQIVTIGQVAIVCCPGEFTTTAGERVRQVVAERLQGRSIRHVLICTYCNDYMGYVTTNEEYQEQAYEGGHTIFGQWTLAAFQTRFVQLAGEMLKPEEERQHDRVTRPVPAPAGELALRSNLAVP